LVFLSALRDLRGESKFFLTAEHAETAEFLTTKAWNKDIFFIGSGLSGEASRLLVFLSDLRGLRGEIN
jgi:hypothetical protein